MNDFRTVMRGLVGCGLVEIGIEPFTKSLAGWDVSEHPGIGVGGEGEIQKFEITGWC